MQTFDSLPIATAPEISTGRVINLQTGEFEDKGEVQQNGDGTDTISTDQPVTDGEQGFLGASVIEPAATLVTGAIAEPIAGIAGIVQSLNPFAEEGAGAQAVEDAREALTFRPKTDEGERGLKVVSDVVAPVAGALEDAETFLGDEAFKATGSPALAAAAKTIPTALLEILGVAAGKAAIKTPKKLSRAVNDAQVKKAVVESAPDIDQIFGTAREVYKEIDNAGVTLKPKPFTGLVNRINKAANKAGFDPDLTPKSAAVLNRFESELGQPKTLTELDTLRKVAQNAAKSVEPADAAIGSIIVDNIDQFLDVVTPTAFNQGAAKASEIIPKYKVARDLWGRGRRSEMINEAFEKAKNQASGFENGLVVQFRSILNNSKKSRFFKKKELDAMREVVRGTTGSNLAKLVGRLGFSEGHATNLIGGSLGVAGGAAFGGPVGAVAVPVIGQVSRKLAQRLTRKNAELADTIIRAGSNAEEIAKAYMKETPRAARSSEELAQLLVRPEISTEKLKLSKNKIFSEAAEIADGQKALIAASTLPGAVAATKQELAK